MDKVSLEDFQITIMNSGASGEFAGDYEGRGYAVTVDSAEQFLLIGAALQESDCAALLNTRPEIDDLQEGMVAIWPYHCFDTGQDDRSSA